MIENGNGTQEKKAGVYPSFHGPCPLPRAMVAITIITNAPDLLNLSATGGVI